MAIPDEVRKCVGFLGYKNAQGIVSLAGTVFFVGVGVPDDTAESFGYAVTAKHVIDFIKEKSTDGKVYFRLNLKDVGAKYAVSKIEDWYFHPTDSSVDVAAINFAHESMFDHLVYPAAWTRNHRSHQHPRNRNRR